MTTTSGLQWSSRFAFIMAAVGCAIGLGNIWRFPYTVGVSGGGAFVLVYLGAILLLALPMLMAELYVGRRGAAGPPAAIAAVAKESGRSPAWRWMGIVLGSGGALMVLSFYSVVGGWTLAYVFKMGAGQLAAATPESAAFVFENMIGETWELLGWFFAFIVLTIAISARGLEAGIEKAVTFMMPALFLMLVAMVVYAAVVGDMAQALRFLFTPDFSKIDSSVVLAAFGQAFFSIGVGITNMMAYGAYIQKTTKLPGASVTIVGADTAVALLAGLAIFPIIFVYGLEPGAGPGLVFITLPFAFSQMPGGQLFGTVFFVLLFFAALTSSISMLEPAVSWLRDSTKLTRRSAAIAAGAVSFTLGILAALSFNELSGFHPLGALPAFADKTFFDLFDFIVTNLMMPTGGILIALFAGWLVQRQFSLDELFDGSDTLGYKAWRFLIRFFAPVVLAFVLFDMLTA